MVDNGTTWRWVGGLVFTGTLAIAGTLYASDQRHEASQDTLLEKSSENINKLLLVSERLLTRQEENVKRFDEVVGRRGNQIGDISESLDEQAKRINDLDRRVTRLER